MELSLILERNKNKNLFIIHNIICAKCYIHKFFIQAI